MKKNDGGLAFGGERLEEGTDLDGVKHVLRIQHPGMTLRDWFAGQAISAIIERCGADHRLPHEHITDYFARKGGET